MCMFLLFLFLCGNLLSPYCLESVSQFFPRCVFPCRGCLFFFLSSSLSLSSSMVAAAAAAAPPSLGCVSVFVLWKNNSALGDLCLFCEPHSPIHGFRVVLSRFRVQNAISTVPKRMVGGRVGVHSGGRIIRIVRSKIYRTESLIRASSHSPIARSHPPARQHHGGKFVHKTILPNANGHPLSSKPQRIHSRLNE